MLAIGVLRLHHPTKCEVLVNYRRAGFLLENAKTNG
jgi:hypothetical protein